MKHFLLGTALFGAGIFVLGGCETARLPSPAELKKIAARTALGTMTTNLETRSQPEKPRAGQVSIWELKVFDKTDQEDGTRQEWKFFEALPQPNSVQAHPTDVLMNAWLISRDGRVFLPSRPSYKQYGSFVTDWAPPRPGPYTLFVEYQPVQQDKTYPLERAHWNVTINPGPTPAKPLSKAAHWKPTQNPAPITLGGLSDGAPAGALSIENLPGKAGDEAIVVVKNAPEGTTEMELAALSAGGQFLHFAPQADGKSFRVVFPKSAMYRVWAYFKLNDALYAAPLNRWVD